MLALLTVSGDRLELAAGRQYVLGRGRDCDIVVKDHACSRRHAQLTVYRNGAAVEDLDSTNGTYVNQERVERRTRLRPGQRLQIGGTLYLLSRDAEAEADEASFVESATVTFEPMRAGLPEKLVAVAPESEVAGQLGSFSLTDVLQLLMQTRRSGTLHFAFEHGRAAIDVRLGDVMDAACGDARGFDALMEIARERRGIFWLVDSDASCERTVEQYGANLLLELCRAVDESNAAKNR